MKIIDSIKEWWDGVRFINAYILVDGDKMYGQLVMQNWISGIHREATMHKEGTVDEVWSSIKTMLDLTIRDGQRPPVVKIFYGDTRLGDHLEEKK